MERNCAPLTLITGAMYTGKSTELIRLIRRHKYANKRVVLIKWKNDTRYSNTHVMTHDHVGEEAKCVNLLSEISDELLSNTDIIGIDEGQFFEKLYEVVAGWIDKYPNLTIIIAALSADYLRNVFGEIWKLAPVASDIKFMTGVCKYCGYDGAAYSVREVKSEEQVLLGSSDKYACACEKCYRKNT